ncbi:MAG: aminotransferase class III-fold pyridoxal phosphate-dependent enzyme, partial [Pseudomonadota bacterium]
MSERNQSLLDRRQRLLGPSYRLFYDDPVHIVRGEGSWLFDADGKRYLDLYNNVPHVGHCHPLVVEAIQKQVATLNTHTRYLHDNVLDYAERLLATFEDELDTALFCCTGSEANELAMRIARAYTGGTGFIVTSYAYHGNTQATYEITTADIPAEKVPAHVATVPVPDPYRGAHGSDGEAWAQHLGEALATLASRGVKPAAFVIDTIASSGGVIAPPPGYLAACARIIREAGALFIADEVQPGFGRTGSHFWGYQADGLVPDIVTMGKPMGNGHPLAGVVTRRDIVDAFADTGDYFNTFGGNPVSAAAGLAVLDVIEQEDLVRNAAETGGALIDEFRALGERHELVGDVRGNGLYIGLELVLDRDSKEPAAAESRRLINRLRERGLLTS